MGGARRVALAPNARVIVADYIAGMTDRYALGEVKRLFRRRRRQDAFARPFC